jgi:hypothetical protein
MSIIDIRREGIDFAGIIELSNSLIFFLY